MVNGLDITCLTVQVIGTVLGVIFAISAIILYYKRKIDDLKPDPEPEIGKSEECITFKSIITYPPEIRENPLILSIFEKKIQALREGIVELNMKQTSTMWSGMFENKNVIYFRATSKIPPKTWEDSFMKGYDMGQRENIKYIEALDPKRKKEIEDRVRKLFTALKVPLLEAHDPEGAFTNFERTFIILKDQLKDLDLLVDLIDTICTQRRYIDIRICYEDDLADDDIVDFGIATSKDGKILLYELYLWHKLVYGGEIMCNEKKIKEAIRRYKNVQAVSEDVLSGTNFESVAKMLHEQSKKGFNLTKLMNKKKEKTGIKQGHICLGCFLQSERRIEKPDWQFLPEHERVWYKMLVDENQQIENYVRDHKPKRIVEVGCGPGRFIKLLKNRIGLDNFEEIVGIDSDPVMFDCAYTRFKDDPKIKIIEMEVKEKNPLPQSDDYFDLNINAMNIVGWQENEKEWVKEMLRCSKCVFFTVYKEGKEDMRLKMYKKRPHDEDAVYINSGKQIILADSAVRPGVRSKAYTKEKITILCEDIKSIYSTDKYDCDYEIDAETNELLYLCFIYKKRKDKEII